MSETWGSCCRSSIPLLVGLDPHPHYPHLLSLLGLLQEAEHQEEIALGSWLSKGRDKQREREKEKEGET